MLPKGVILRTEKNVLYWRNTTYNISVEEAATVAAEIIKLAQSPEVQVMLIDNRGARGAWPMEVNPIWGELMGALAKQIHKSATVAGTVVVMQINRLSKASGTLEQIQAFETIRQAQAFLGVSLASFE